MERKVILLQAIKNGFLAQSEVSPQPSAESIVLEYAKEGKALNYQIEGNINIIGEPTVDVPATIEGVGVRRGDNYYIMKTIDKNGRKAVVKFLVPGVLYKVGSVVDKIDYETQSTYLYTKFFNLIHMAQSETMEVFRKDEDVVYMSLPYQGRTDAPCYSSIWPFNEEGTFNSENIGVDNNGDEPLLYFGFSWNRLNLVYENSVAYRVDDIEKTPLTDSEIVEVFFDYMCGLEENLLEVLGALYYPTVINTVLPPLVLTAGENTISVTIIDCAVYFATEGKDYIVTEEGKYLTTENSNTVKGVLVTSAGEILVSQDGEILVVGESIDILPPDRILVTYKSSMKLT